MDTRQALMDGTTHAEIVQGLSDKLKAYYVFPEIAEQICARLQEYLKDGEYTYIKSGSVFSDKLTKHLQEVNHDSRLLVRWCAEPLPDDEGPLRHSQEWQDERHLEARLYRLNAHFEASIPIGKRPLD